MKMKPWQYKIFTDELTKIIEAEKINGIPGG